MTTISTTRLRAFGRLQIDDALIQTFAERQAKLQLSRLASLFQIIDLRGSLRGDPHDKPAVELFHEAAEASPSTFSAVISRPAIASWMHYVLNPASPAYIDVPKGPMRISLASHAASLALKAKLDTELALPIDRQGAVTIPGLGAAMFREASAGSAAFQTSNGIARLTVGSQKVELTSTGDRKISASTNGACRWLPVHFISADHDGQHLDIELNPFEDFVGFGDIHPRAFDFNVDEWQRAISQAWQLLVQLQPHHARSMSRIITTYFADYPYGDSVRNSTNSLAFGATKLTLLHDPYDLCDTLVHEFHHTKLHALTREVELFDHRDKRLYYAPWRLDPRPLTGFLQGIYAFTAVASYQATLIQRVASDFIRKQAMANFAYARAQVALALSQLEVTRSLTASGKAIADGIADVTKELNQVEVDAEALRHAEAKLRERSEAFHRNHGQAVHAAG